MYGQASAPGTSCKTCPGSNDVKVIPASSPALSNAAFNPGPDPGGTGTTCVCVCDVPRVIKWRSHITTSRGAKAETSASLYAAISDWTVGGRTTPAG